MLLLHLLKVLRCRVDHNSNGQNVVREQSVMIKALVESFSWRDFQVATVVGVAIE